LGKNYRSEAISWQKMGHALPKEGDLIGITHEQGYRIAYYGWRHVTPWPYTAEDEAPLALRPDPMAEFATRFENAVKGQEYFVVTLFGDFNAQPMLKSYLLENYPVYAEGDGYLIFNLTRSKVSAP
jgi:hypothetical protein